MPRSPQAKAAGALLFLVLLQIYLGALVAGLDAGYSYNTWPLMDGVFIPGADKLFVMKSFWENFADNPNRHSKRQIRKLADDSVFDLGSWSGASPYYVDALSGQLTSSPY